MKQIIKRSLKFSLKEANTAKKSFLNKLCEVAGVQHHIVPAQNTSRICPECRTMDKANRQAERFKCISCGFEADADYVGAVNILHRFLSKVIAEELTVPLPARPLNKCL
jgi:transposase